MTERAVRVKHIQRKTPWTWLPRPPVQRTLEIGGEKSSNDVPMYG